MKAIHDCMEQMGVIRWRSTYPLPGARQIIEYETYAVRKVGESRTVSQLDLQVIPTTALSDVQIKNLLRSMLAAVGFQCEPVQTLPDAADPFIRIVMGLPLIQHLLQSTEVLDCLRADNGHRESRLWVTYHPADLLTQPEHKRKAWDDLKAWAASVK